MVHLLGFRGALAQSLDHGAVRPVRHDRDDQTSSASAPEQGEPSPPPTAAQLTAKNNGASTIVNTLTSAERANMGPAMTDLRRNVTMRRDEEQGHQHVVMGVTNTFEQNERIGQEEIDAKPPGWSSSWDR